MSLSAFDLAKLLHLIKEKPDSTIRVNILAIVTYYEYADISLLRAEYSKRFGALKSGVLESELGALVIERKLARIIVNKTNTLYFNEDSSFEVIK